MTHKAVIRIAEVVAGDVLRDPEAIPAGRELVQRGALRLISDDVPLIIDHDRDQRIGVVSELVEWPMVDGLWLAARVTITEPLPGWLRRGSAASMGWARVSTQQIAGWSRVLKALLNEVSVLSPGVPPKEPRAQVVLLERSNGSPGASSDRLAPGDVVIGGVSDEEFERWGAAYQASLIAEGMRTREGRAKLACLGLLKAGELAA
jgi:hypothetical protein